MTNAFGLRWVRKTKASQSLNPLSLQVGEKPTTPDCRRRRNLEAMPEHRPTLRKSGEWGVWGSHPKPIGNRNLYRGEPTGPNRTGTNGGGERKVFVEGAGAKKYRAENKKKKGSPHPTHAPVRSCVHARCVGGLYRLPCGQGAARR